MTCSGVIFENDGVWVDSEIISIAVEPKILSTYGLQYTQDEFIARFVGTSDDAFYTALNADCRAQTGKPLPEDIEQQIDAIKWPRFGAELEPLDGVVALASCSDGPTAATPTKAAPSVCARQRA